MHPRAPLAFQPQLHHLLIPMSTRTRSNSGTSQATTKLVAMQQVETRPQEALRPRRGHAASTRSSQRRPSLRARSVNTLAFSVSGGREAEAEQPRGGCLSVSVWKDEMVRSSCASGALRHCREHGRAGRQVVGGWGKQPLRHYTQRHNPLHPNTPQSPARAQATRQRMSKARLIRRFHTSAGSTEVMGRDVSKLCPSLQSAGKGGGMEAGLLMSGC